MAGYGYGGAGAGNPRDAITRALMQITAPPPQTRLPTRRRCRRQHHRRCLVRRRWRAELHRNPA